MAKTKPMPAGDLDRLINITVKNESLNLKGEKMDSTFGPFLYNVPAYVQAKGGTETPEADRETAFGKVQFTIRYEPTIKPTMRVVYEFQDYDIESVAEGEGRKQWTVIDAKKHN